MSAGQGKAEWPPLSRRLQALLVVGTGQGPLLSPPVGLVLMDSPVSADSL